MISVHTMIILGIISHSASIAFENSSSLSHTKPTAPLISNHPAPPPQDPVHRCALLVARICPRDHRGGPQLGLQAPIPGPARLLSRRRRPHDVRPPNSEHAPPLRCSPSFLPLSPSCRHLPRAPPILYPVPVSVRRFVALMCERGNGGRRGEGGRQRGFLSLRRSLRQRLRASPCSCLSPSIS
jgi:hypothetical protein